MITASTIYPISDELETKRKGCANLCAIEDIRLKSNGIQVDYVSVFRRRTFDGCGN